jgi:hypothetical protein
VADRNRARTLRFRDLADEVDMKQAVFETCARHLHVIGKLEAALESPCCDTLI